MTSSSAAARRAASSRAALLARRGFRVMVLGHEPAVGRVRRRRPDAVGGAGAAAAARRAAHRARVQGARRHRARQAQDGDVARCRSACSLPGQRLDVTRDRARAGARARAGVRGRGRLGRRVIERLRDAARLLDPMFASAITLPPNGFWERREVGRLRSLLPKPTTDLFAPLPPSIRSARWRRCRRSTARRSVAHDVGPIGEARAFEIARRGQPRFEGGLAEPAGAAAGAAGDVRRRSARAPDARRDRRPARARRRRARAAARRNHRLPSPAVGGLGGGPGRGAGARRASRRTSARRPRA